MSIRALNRVFYLTTGVLASLLAVFAVLLFFGQRDVKLATSLRYASYLLADELRQSSDDLTRMARTYVVTGDARFERMYWKILAIRNGEARRPRDYERIYWDLVAAEPNFEAGDPEAGPSLRARMQQLGFTSSELAKLQEAEDHSNRLVQLERAAFNARKGGAGAPDPERARRLLHDARYHDAKAAIMTPLNEFYGLLDARTRTAVASSERDAGSYLSAVLVLLGLVLAWLALGHVVMRRKVVSVVQLAHGTRDLGAGTYTSEVDIDSKDEIGVLARAFVALDRKVAERTSALEQEVIAAQRARASAEAAEQKMRDLGEHYRLLFDRNPLPMWAVDPDSLRFLSVNDAAVRHYGYARAELLGMTLLDIRPPEDVAAFEASVRARPLSGDRPISVSRHQKKDGTIIYVEATGDTAILDGRAVRLIVNNDVTERRRTEEALDRQRQAVMRQDKLAAMSGLLAGVAHELNNPLSVVIGNATLLQTEAGAGPLARRGERILNAAQRCARIVKNFLALVRHQPRQVQAVDLHEAVREAVQIVAYALRVDGVAVDYDLDPATPAAWGDAHELGQVMVNLIVNAQQAMHEAPAPRRLLLGSRYDRERERVQLRVSDTGPGIPLDIQQRIFEPLFTTKPPGQGTGLGLSICTAILERHGGSLHVTSEPGRGTTFTVDVPIGGPAASSDASVSEDVAPAATADILVVDDEAEVGDLVRELLAAAGHRVVVAANGVKALECLHEHAYDVIISDMRMPELDGPGLYRAVQRWRPALCSRFVFMTGDALGSETTAFLETMRTLHKPFRPQEIHDAVGDVLAGAGTSVSLPAA